MAQVELDNRGLEPPEPMTRILEAIERLPDGEVLLARNDRRPMFLFPILEERHYACEVTDLPDGSVRLKIYKR